MGKKSKTIEAKLFNDGKSANFIPGWIGGNLTSPAAQKIAKERLKSRILAFESARRGGLADTHHVEEAPAPAFGR